MTLIRPASPDDSLQVARAIDACRRALNDAGIPQWDDLYPSDRIIGAAIDAGSLYVATKGDRILGGLGLDEDQPAEYGALAWSTDLPTLVAHHLFVHPEHQRRGLATLLMQFVESLAARRGASIRLDAYSGNPAALALYETRGYTRVGQVFFPRRELPFVCFEKTV